MGQRMWGNQNGWSLEDRELERRQSSGDLQRFCLSLQLSINQHTDVRRSPEASGAVVGGRKGVEESFPSADKGQE